MIMEIYELEVIYLREPAPNYAKLAKSQVETWCPKLTYRVDEAIRTAKNIVEDVKYRERSRVMSLEGRTTSIRGCDVDGYFFEVHSPNIARRVLKVRYKRHIK